MSQMSNLTWIKSKNKLIILMNNNYNISIFVRFNFVKTKKNNSLQKNCKRVRLKIFFLSKSIMNILLLISGLESLRGTIVLVLLLPIWFGLRFTQRLKVRHKLISSLSNTSTNLLMLIKAQTIS